MKRSELTSFNVIKANQGVYSIGPFAFLLYMFLFIYLSAKRLIEFALIECALAVYVFGAVRFLPKMPVA
ncbi:MAG: hypothetical protein CL599_18940 [Alteromonas sp.]|nr:hypothetical protein [Alteromonas sp.]OUX83585.1 MAG: hypothetical protein CBB95_18790 [Alteromonas sp. TMED35]